MDLQETCLHSEEIVKNSFIDIYRDRIRLPDGEMIRIAYAEQNGHPFRPMLAHAGKSLLGLYAPGGGCALFLGHKGRHKTLPSRL